MIGGYFILDVHLLGRHLGLSCGCGGVVRDTTNANGMGEQCIYHLDTYLMINIHLDTSNKVEIVHLGRNLAISVAEHVSIAKHAKCCHQDKSASESRGAEGAGESFHFGRARGVEIWIIDESIICETRTCRLSSYLDSYTLSRQF